MPSEPVKTVKKPVKMYQFYAELCYYEPKVWRRFLISPNYSMEDLAFMLMVLFNADNSHLYRFEIPVRDIKKRALRRKKMLAAQINEELSDVRDIEVESYVDDDMDFADDMFMRNRLKQLPPKRYEVCEVLIKKLLTEEINKCTFVYDFGDDWNFKVKLENVDVESETRIPKLLSGEGLGIIEDCGGADGLYRICEAFNKKSGEDYENYQEWFGVSELELNSYDAATITKTIKKIWKR